MLPMAVCVCECVCVSTTTMIMAARTRRAAQEASMKQKQNRKKNFSHLRQNAINASEKVSAAAVTSIEKPFYTLYP